MQESPHESGSLLQISEPLPTIAPHTLFDVGPFSVANSTLTLMLIAVLLWVFATFVVGRFHIRGSRLQFAIEMMYESVRNLISGIVGGVEKAEKIMPVIGSVLLFIALANLLPLIPFVSSFTVASHGEHVQMFRGATTDFNVTFVMAVCVVLVMQYIGIKSQGAGVYLSHFIQIKQVAKGFRKGFAAGSLSLVGFFVGLVEIIAEIAKMASLSLRLFGNMFAHEVLTVILLGVCAYVIPVVWMGMGILVGIVQAVVFMSLTAVYFSIVSAPHEADAHA